MTELHPAVADLDPRLGPLSEQDVDLDGIDIVVNTHLHFDHCGRALRAGRHPELVWLAHAHEPWRPRVG